MRSTVPRSNGEKVAAGSAASASAAWRRRASGSGGRVLGHGNVVSSQVVAAYRPGAQQAGGRRLAVHPERAPAQTQHGRRVAAQRRAHGAGEGGPQRRVEVPGEQHAEHVGPRQARAPDPALLVHEAAAAAGPPRRRSTSRREIGQRIAREGPAGAAAERAAAPAARRRRCRGRAGRGRPPPPPSRARAAPPAPDSGARMPARPWCRTRFRRARSARRRARAGSPPCPRPCRRSCRRPRLGPREAAQRAAAVVASSRLASSSERQRSAPESPVPRWSNTIASRLRCAA